ncbi:nucleotide sugar dehydrogenase [Nocardioides sp. SYSU DS0663]|uniref:nucleotide sugar dehydrogenase n=1 Tax=Nocardioides sp. SYSU DS0663 TaxID=3416445 RepID=UPI003F4BAD7E
MSDLVVVGLGYVGLPLVAEACRAGLQVTGLDVSPRVVEGLNAGRSHVDDLSDEQVGAMLAAGFTATSDASCVAEADAVVICVPTPLSADGGPDLAAVESACRGIGPHLGPGTLVVLESTTYPGTTAEVVRPLLEELSGLGPDELPLAYSPERIDPGNPTYGLKNTPKVVGADDPAAQERARAFYAQVVDTVVVARGTREAESAKLLENTYRHVNIALVNEMVRFFHELDIDFWEVIRLASTKPFGFQAFTPGPGVGGHCIPIDPNYLSHRVRTQLGYGFRFVELAQEINSSMPAYVVSRVTALLNDQEKAVRGSTVLLLGVTYKPDIADQRESPALDVAKRLLQLGARVEYHDPHVEHWDVAGTVRADDDVLAAVGRADVTVLLQHHAEYDVAALEQSAACLLDTRGRTTGEKAHRL